ncbi:tubulin binding cofactor A [Aaosphaeria arxii CBS 175.79]|uniref:Tubulin-specific chaperone A n=1 Tax=Aaosphaeria arxii CBS 175.79 TaxID=1450172 RepID=A0A6A5XGS8_9PLEO|nr:tubulin binding cofactor A [Aaosphaeria arxii CBS 175.79]KAF2012001.1 tubulin binding cofactor A [Aaosphaeria arxii CBS 175.79]
MAPPSKLAVATSSVIRLVKEEASYHKELEQQEARIKKLEANPAEDNSEYQIKQERQALEETKAVLPAVREKIRQAIERVEEELEANKEAGGVAPEAEVTKAEDAITAGKKSIAEST